MCSSLLPQKATFFHVVRVAEEWEAVHVDGGVSAKQFFFSFSLFFLSAFSISLPGFLFVTKKVIFFFKPNFSSSISNHLLNKK